MTARPTAILMTVTFLAIAFSAGSTRASALPQTPAQPINVDRTPVPARLRFESPIRSWPFHLRPRLITRPAPLTLEHWTVNVPVRPF